MDSGFDEGRSFMDWRKAILIFALMSGKLPSHADKMSYFSKLRAKISTTPVTDANSQKTVQLQTLDKASFVEIEAWFDKCESTLMPLPHSNDNKNA